MRLISHVSGDNSSHVGQPTIEYILSLDANAKHCNAIKEKERKIKKRIV
jgi:hypothetical protein